MTARELQKAVAEDIEALLANDHFKTPDGGMAAPKAYTQQLPKREIINNVENDGDEDQAPYEDQSADESQVPDEDPFPYVIVRIDSGGIDSQIDPHKVALLLLIGIFDDDKSNQGHASVLEIIERIQRHYEETPLLANQFKFIDPFHWALQDEESWPYFFGACNLNFELPPPRTKWSELV